MARLGHLIRTCREVSIPNEPVAQELFDRFIETGDTDFLDASVKARLRVWRVEDYCTFLQGFSLITESMCCHVDFETEVAARAWMADHPIRTVTMFEEIVEWLRQLRWNVVDKSVLRRWAIPEGHPTLAG